MNYNLLYIKNLKRQGGKYIKEELKDFSIRNVNDKNT